MRTSGRIAKFTAEIAAEGVLDRLLDDLPPEDVAAALAGIARDRGLAAGPQDFRPYLRGLDVRLA